VIALSISQPMGLSTNGSLRRAEDALPPCPAYQAPTAIRAIMARSEAQVIIAGTVNHSGSSLFIVASRAVVTQLVKRAGSTETMKQLTRCNYCEFSI
jgi:hypothetical protein